MPSLIYSYKIKARHFHSTKHLLDDLCAVNDGGEFGRSFCVTYPKEFEIKVENLGDHIIFLNLDITIKEVTFYI